MMATPSRIVFSGFKQVSDAIKTVPPETFGKQRLTVILMKDLKIQREVLILADVGKSVC
jgi:hypothetical protein